MAGGVYIVCTFRNIRVLNEILVLFKDYSSLILIEL